MLPDRLTDSLAQTAAVDSPFKLPDRLPDILAQTAAVDSPFMLPNGLLDSLAHTVAVDSPFMLPDRLPDILAQTAAVDSPFMLPDRLPDILAQTAAASCHHEHYTAPHSLSRFTACCLVNRPPGRPLSSCELLIVKIYKLAFYHGKLLSGGREEWGRDLFHSFLPYSKVNGICMVHFIR
jgi:hypothetical protein